MLLFSPPQNCLRIQPKTLLKEGSAAVRFTPEASKSHRLSMSDLGSIFRDKIPAFNHVPLAASAVSAAFFSFCFSLFFLFRDAFLPIALN